METLTETKKTSFKLVLIDETSFWKDEIQKKAGKLEKLYLFDENRVTYCCEITPSFELIPLYTVTEKSVDDETFEQILSNDNADEPIYISYSSMGSYKTFEPHAKLDFELESEEQYLEELERVTEYLNCNHEV